MSDAPTSLRDYRKLHGLTLKALGQRFGVNKTTIMRWEEGALSAERALTVEALTGVPKECLRPDVFGSADPAKVPEPMLEAPGSDVSNDAPEASACPTSSLSPATKSLARSA